MARAPEHELLLIASRIELEQPLRERFRTLMESGLDWGRILYLSANHKIITLLWHHIKSLQCAKLLDSQISRLLETAHSAHYERNAAYLEEFTALIAAANAKRIEIAPLKGSFLMGNVYGDLGMRTMNDIDILVRPRDVEAVKSICGDLGYQQKKYNPLTGALESLPREQQLLWRFYISNLYPFRKKADSSIVGCFNFDVHVSITWKGKEEFVVDTDDLLDRAEPYHTNYGTISRISFEDYVIHLCCHLYRHAVLLQTIYDKDDLALIKFCDIREYIKKYGGPDSWNRLRERIERFGLERPVYYSLYYLRDLYGDTIPDSFLESIRPESVDYLNRYGMFDTDESLVWSMDFSERLFNFERAAVERRRHPGLFERYLLNASKPMPAS